ncbi:transcriptional regulator [Saccharomonospora azurea]|uniref:transcriptional regulator n=1 Tax=Saccharomonospora azurea TaxID=40988 RepID=UPI003D8A129B
MSDRRSTTSRALLIAGACVLSLVVCCGLAWWQWDRFTSAGGSFQNLGYVLQWPLFGLFPAFMFWRMARLRKQAATREAETSDDSQTPHTSTRVRSHSARTAAPRPRPTEVATHSAPRSDQRNEPLDDEDAALAEYNAYLAQLNAREQERN